MQDPLRVFLNGIGPLNRRMMKNIYVEYVEYLEPWEWAQLEERKDMSKFDILDHQEARIRRYVRDKGLKLTFIEDAGKREIPRQVQELVSVSEWDEDGVAGRYRVLLGHLRFMYLCGYVAKSAMPGCLIRWLSCR
jgi:hypothetical protein